MIQGSEGINEHASAESGIWLSSITEKCEISLLLPLKILNFLWCLSKIPLHCLHKSTSEAPAQSIVRRQGNQIITGCRAGAGPGWEYWAIKRGSIGNGNGAVSNLDTLHLGLRFEA